MSQAVRTICHEHRDCLQVFECLCQLLDRLDERGDNQRRHIGWENRLVLPLAGRRLTGSDLERLGHAKAVRRGIPYLG